MVYSSDIASVERLKEKVIIAFATLKQHIGKCSWRFNKKSTVVHATTWTSLPQIFKLKKKKNWWKVDVLCHRVRTCLQMLVEHRVESWSSARVKKNFILYFSLSYMTLCIINKWSSNYVQIKRSKTHRNAYRTDWQIQIRLSRLHLHARETGG